jgi:GntR family transcriptional regulator
VLKAYRELEHAGLVAARPGVGTLITGSLADPVITANGRLRSQLRGWIVQARQAGLDEESIEALFRDAVRSAHIQEVA